MPDHAGLQIVVGLILVAGFGRVLVRTRLRDTTLVEIGIWAAGLLVLNGLWHVLSGHAVLQSVVRGLQLLVFIAPLIERWVVRGWRRVHREPDAELRDQHDQRNQRDQRGR